MIFTYKGRFSWLNCVFCNEEHNGGKSIDRDKDTKLAHTEIYGPRDDTLIFVHYVGVGYNTHSHARATST